MSWHLDLPVNTYANLGDYICESCGFHRPPLTVAVDELTELTNTSSHFKINGTNYHINIGASTIFTTPLLQLRWPIILM